MRSMVCAAIVVALSSLAACDNSPPLDSSPAAQSPPVQTGADAAASPAGGPVNAGPAKAAVPDVGLGANSSGVRIVGAPPSCDALAGDGAPDTLIDFSWSYQVAPGQSSRVWDYMWIDNGCQLRFQHEDAERTTAMSAADCATARAWVTNSRVLEVLRTGSGCPYGDGNATEMLELTLTDEGRVARKTYKCPEPTLEVLRACLQPLIDDYFPR